MIVQCSDCDKFLDDEFRNTSCPHEAFLANDGQNKFKIYEESWLADNRPRRGFYCPSFCAGGQSEHDKYLDFLNNNKVNKNGR